MNNLKSRSACLSIEISAVGMRVEDGIHSGVLKGTGHEFFTTFRPEMDHKAVLGLWGDLHRGGTFLSPRLLRVKGPGIAVEEEEGISSVPFWPEKGEQCPLRPQ